MSAANEWMNVNRTEQVDDDDDNWRWPCQSVISAHLANCSLFFSLSFIFCRTSYSEKSAFNLPSLLFLGQLELLCLHSSSSKRRRVITNFSFLHSLHICHTICPALIVWLQSFQRMEQQKNVSFHYSLSSHSHLLLLLHFSHSAMVTNCNWGMHADRQTDRQTVEL